MSDIVFSSLFIARLTCFDEDILGSGARPLHLEHLEVSALHALSDYLGGAKVISGGDLVDVAGDLIVAVVVLPVGDCVPRGGAAPLPLRQLDETWRGRTFYRVTYRHMESTYRGGNGSD